MRVTPSASICVSDVIAGGRFHAQRARSPRKTGVKQRLAPPSVAAIVISALHSVGAHGVGEEFYLRVSPPRSPFLPLLVILKAHPIISASVRIRQAQVLLPAPPHLVHPLDCQTSKTASLEGGLQHACNTPHRGDLGPCCSLHTPLTFRIAPTERDIMR